MKVQVFTKVLAPVEVAPRGANYHQRELNAGQLRQQLGFPYRDTRGRLELTCWPSDSRRPVVVTCEYTLYEARKSDMTRDEWRLYPKTDAIENHARAGDLLLVIRPNPASNRLVAMIARPGTAFAHTIRAFG